MNEFTRNKASSKGGAIYYNLYSPLGIKNNTFTSNAASYGPDFASFPSKLEILNKDTTFLSSLVSG